LTGPLPTRPALINGTTEWGRETFGFVANRAGSTAQKLAVRCFGRGRQGSGQNGVLIRSLPHLPLEPIIPKAAKASTERAGHRLPVASRKKVLVGLIVTSRRNVLQIDFLLLMDLGSSECIEPVLQPADLSAQLHRVERGVDSLEFLLRLFGQDT